MIVRIRVALALLTAAALAGCADDGVSIACTDELGVRVTPRDTTVSVGAAFTPGVRFSTCGGRKVWEPVVSFSSNAPEVVRMDAVNRRLEAIAPGTARVLVRDTFNSPVGWLDVTVIP